MYQFRNPFMVVESVEFGCCSHSCFYVTGGRKDNKNKKHAFSELKKMTLLPDKQLITIVPFRSTKYRKKELYVDNKMNSLLEMCIIHQVEMKSVVIFQPLKRLVPTNVRSAKPATTF